MTSGKKKIRLEEGSSQSPDPFTQMKPFCKVEWSRLWKRSLKSKWCSARFCFFFFLSLYFVSKLLFSLHSEVKLLLVFTLVNRVWLLIAVHHYLVQQKKHYYKLVFLQIAETWAAVDILDVSSNLLIIIEFYQPCPLQILHQSVGWS